MKTLILAGLLSVVLVASPIIPAIAGNGNQQKGQEKVQICHRSEDDNKYIRISVAASAVEAHLNHGDVVGEDIDCQDDSPEPMIETLACPFSEIEVCAFTMGFDSPCFQACIDSEEDACATYISEDCSNLIISISGCTCY